MRADETRAASMVQALPPPLEATTTIDSALTWPTGGPSDVVAVARRGRLIGVLARRELERAAAFGLGGLQLADLLVVDLLVVAPNASRATVLEALNGGPAPFVVVRAPGAKPSGFVDRRQLERFGSTTKTRGSLPGSSAARMRTALRRCISAPALAALADLGRRASLAGGRACLVGGAVRDLSLGRPTRDLDVIVEGQLRELLRGLGLEVKIHSRFLTATVVLDDGTSIDVAHARSERYARPAALPQVEAATVEDDLARRDFTINTLALSVEPHRFGAVLDLCGAAEDLAQRRIRVLHGLSFIDDPTRAFRAVSLAARLEFEIERRTAHAIELALEQGIFERLSSTRLRREVERMLSAPEFPTSMRLAARHGLLRALSRGLELPTCSRSRLDRAAKAIIWYRGLQRNEAFQAWLVPLGLLSMEADPRITSEVLERLQPGRRATRVLRRCRESVSELIAELTRRPRPSPSIVYFAGSHLEVEILLVALACAPRRGTRNAIRRHLESQREIRLEIDGRDLLRAGVPAGRAVARGLEAALAAKLDGQAGDAVEQLRRALLGAADGQDPA